MLAPVSQLAAMVSSAWWLIGFRATLVGASEEIYRGRIARPFLSNLITRLARNARASFLVLLSCPAAPVANLKSLLQRVQESSSFLRAALSQGWTGARELLGCSLCSLWLETSRQSTLSLLCSGFWPLVGCVAKSSRRLALQFKGRVLGILVVGLRGEAMAWLRLRSCGRARFGNGLTGCYGAVCL